MRNEFNPREFIFDMFFILYLLCEMNSITKMQGSKKKKNIREKFLYLEEQLHAALRALNKDETGFELAPKTGKVIGIRGRNVNEECNNSDKVP
ncbi:uncharacterized protein LOC136090142 isoform X2 [Hydra vulgaris]|uniref:Uncharacterized protein LOC136090142 isoform X2 n=1 Tax=Hydra vulgaris TaxID=6087 RepID=A0ABM4DD41_HYDVU